MWMYEYTSERWFSILGGICLEVELLDHLIILFGGIAMLFSTLVVLVYVLPSMEEGSNSAHTESTLYYLPFWS